MFTSSGNTSQTESAFEDDFDFFGISKKTAQNDPWQKRTTTPQDPFVPSEARSSGSEDQKQCWSVFDKIRSTLFIYLFIAGSGIV
jgi:hypothetical protein